MTGHLILSGWRNRLAGRLTLALASGILCFAGTANAAVYYVDGTGGSNGNTGTGGWGDAKLTIQAAIDDAAAAAPSEVWVKADTYNEAITMADDVTVYGGFDGTEVGLFQRNWVTNVTTINGIGNLHVVTFNAVFTSVLDGFTITGGNANGGGSDNNGGGVYFDTVDDTVELANCTVSNNIASGNGAGIYLNNSSAAIYDCTIQTNAASGNGGGIAIDNGSFPSFDDCVIFENSADNLGAGVYVSDLFTFATLTNCTIYHNSALTAGGGIQVENAGAIALTSCIVAGNSSPSSGGGIRINDDFGSSIDQSIISGNVSTNQGGGFHLDNSSPAIRNCIVSGNSGIQGGAFAITTGSAPQIFNCTIDSNGAISQGGAFFLSASSPTLENLIVTNNALFAIHESDATSDPTLQYCLFDGNQNGAYVDENVTTYLDSDTATLDTNVTEANNNLNGSPDYVMDSAFGITGTWTSVSYNAGTGRTTFTDSTASWAPNEFQYMMMNPETSQRIEVFIESNTATEIVVVNDATVLASASDTYKIIDYRLEATSPAVDAATAAVAPPNDIESVGRPYGAADDIGAYEYFLHVLSITRDTPAAALTNASAVTFRILFSEAVTGVAGVNFTLDPSVEQLAASKNGVSGSGDTWYLDALPDTGADGTLSVDLDSNLALIQKTGGYSMPNAFTDGEIYSFDHGAPSGTISVPADTTRVTTSLSLGFTASDANSGVASTALYVRTPGSGSFVDSGLSQTGTSGSFNYTIAAGNGLYEFAALSTDNVTNAETAPASAETSVLVNTVQNGAFTQDAAIGSQSLLFPMEDDLDIQIDVTATATGTITVSRTEGDNAPAGYTASMLIDEQLTITSTGLGSPTADLYWNYDPASEAGLIGTFNTVFQFESGVLSNTYPVTPAGNQAAVTGITSFSDWYAGDGTSDVDDWMVLEK